MTRRSATRWTSSWPRSARRASRAAVVVAAGTAAAALRLTRIAAPAAMPGGARPALESPQLPTTGAHSPTRRRDTGMVSSVGGHRLAVICVLGTADDGAASANTNQGDIRGFRGPSRGPGGAREIGSAPGGPRAMRRESRAPRRIRDQPAVVTARRASPVTPRRTSIFILPSIWTIGGPMRPAMTTVAPCSMRNRAIRP